MRRAMADQLCEPCSAHFKEVKELLGESRRAVRRGPRPGAGARLLHENGLRVHRHRSGCRTERGRWRWPVRRAWPSRSVGAGLLASGSPWVSIGSSSPPSVAPEHRSRCVHRVRSPASATALIAASALRRRRDPHRPRHRRPLGQDPVPVGQPLRGAGDRRAQGLRASRSTFEPGWRSESTSRSTTCRNGSGRGP